MIKTFREYIKEENTQGDVGTDKLTRNRKKMTPGEPLVTPEPYKNFTKDSLKAS